MRTIILLAVFILTGIVIYLLRRFTGSGARSVKDDKSVREEKSEKSIVETNTDSECCGAHEICEKTGKYNPKFQPEYYDDEELDEYFKFFSYHTKPPPYICGIYIYNTLL